MGTTMIGDLRQHLLSVRHNSQLKNRIETLTQELTTGRVANLIEHLGRDHSRLLDIDRQQSLSTAYTRGAKEMGQMLGAMQRGLDLVNDLRSTIAGPLVNTTDSTPPQQQQDASRQARSAFSGMVNALNTRFGDRALFGGTAINANPLAEPDAIFAEVLLVAQTGTDTASVVAAIDTWFDGPGSAYESTAYRGGDPMTRKLSATQPVTIDPTASDPAIREILKMAAIGAIAGEGALSVDEQSRSELRRYAGEGLLSAAQGLIGLQTGIGYLQAQADEEITRTTATHSALQIARNEMISADPFQTATALEQTQIQLETHFALTARLSRLSLTEYLR